MAIVAAAGLMAAWVTLAIFLPAIGEVGRMELGSPALPRTIQACGNTWDRGSTIVARTRDEAFTLDDRDPIIVEPSTAVDCPAGACGAGASADKGCATVIYVKTGADAFVPYELLGGP